MVIAQEQNFWLREVIICFMTENECIRDDLLTLPN